MKSAGTHVVILCSRLDLPGGIERAIVNTANLFAANNHKVTLLILDQTSATFYPLHEKINIVQRHLSFGMGDSGHFFSRKIDFVSDIFALRKILKAVNGSATIATEYPFAIAAHIAANKTSVSVFAWEHHHFHSLGKSIFWKGLFRLIYPRLSAVVCLNALEASFFKEMGCKTTVIPNYVTVNIQSALNAKTILSIGWLSDVKGFDRIPAVGKFIFEHHPDWKWIVIGKGEMGPLLQQRIAEEGLHTNIIIKPPKSHVLNDVYLNASVYAMTSRFECFPMVLLEAASHGLPSVAFNCPTGPAFIIRNGADGVIVPQDDIEAMASAINNLIEDHEKRRTFGEAARKGVERFSPLKVYSLWQKLLTGDEKPQP